MRRKAPSSPSRTALQQLIFARRQQRQPCPLRVAFDSDRLETEEEADEADAPNEVIVKKKDLTEGTLYIGMEADANVEVPGNGGLRVRSYNDPE